MTPWRFLPVLAEALLKDMESSTDKGCHSTSHPEMFDRLGSGREGAEELEKSNVPQRTSVSRRQFIKYALAAGVGGLASMYVKPAIKTIGISPAFANLTPMPDPGWTPDPTPTPTHTPTPSSNPAPTARPTPTPTPFPPLTAVPEQWITPVDPGRGKTWVVHPTAPAILELPGSGVRLEVPAPVQQTTFQVRLQAADTELDVPPPGQVLRAFMVELFDVDGKPLSGVRFWFPARLSVALTESEVRGLGGIGRVLNEYAFGRLCLRRFAPSPTGGSWPKLYTDFDIIGRNFSGQVRYFSTFALVLSPQPDG